MDIRSWLKKQWKAAKPLRKKVSPYFTFFNLHILYISLLGIGGAFIIWVGPQGTEEGISFLDALFAAASAACGCGAVSVYMATFSPLGYVTLTLLVMLGSNVLTSVFAVLIRIEVFRKYFRDQEKLNRFEDQQKINLLQDDDNFQKRSLKTFYSMREPSLTSQMSIDSVTAINAQEPSLVTDVITDVSLARTDEIGGEVDASADSDVLTNNRSSANFDDLSIRSWSPTSAAQRVNLFKRKNVIASNQPGKSHARRRRRNPLRLPPRASWSSVDPNKADHIKLPAITEEVLRIDYLNRLEMRALQELRWIVLTYFVVFQVLGFLLSWMALGIPRSEREILKGKNGVEPWYFAAFQTVCAFNQVGFCILDDQYIQLQRAVIFLAIQCVLILLGNTLYPVALRVIIWLLRKYAKKSKNEKREEAYEYLLDHPRHCFTHLFPPQETQWLLITVLLFNFVEIVSFLVLDWNQIALKHLPPFYKITAAVAQSIGTRNAGFTIIAIANLSPPMWILYIGLMYVAVYPVHFARVNSRFTQRRDKQNTNVNNENENKNEMDNKEAEDHPISLETDLNEKLAQSEYSTLHQAWHLVARDSFLVFMAIFVASIFEVDKITKEGYHVFTFIFEIVGLYSGVGFSLGITCNTPNCVAPPYGFCGSWGTAGKMVAILVLLAGRHRTLPENIDYTVNIPKRITEGNKELKEKRKEYQRMQTMRQRQEEGSNALTEETSRSPSMTTLRQGNDDRAPENWAAPGLPDFTAKSNLGSKSKSTDVRQRTHSLEDEQFAFV